MEQDVTGDGREVIPHGVSVRLERVVREVLGAPAVTTGAWKATPLLGGARAYDPARTLCAVSGTARIGANEHVWSVILKGFAPVPERDDPADSSYWKREWLLYRSGILDSLSRGLRAPRCYGYEELEDGSVWLWLEHVQEDGDPEWGVQRWALAARHLGQFNGAYPAEAQSLQVPWLGGNRLRQWVERHAPLVERIAAAPEIREVRRWWPQPVVDAVLRLWEERAIFCDALDRLPRTFGHGDAIRRNLLARRGADGDEDTVAIDWEHAGLYAAGEEVGQTLSVAAAFYDVDPKDLPALDEVLFESYLVGLRDAGWNGDPRQVRFAYTAHAALHNAFNAVGSTVPDETGRARARENYGHSWEELAERRAVLRPFLLECTEEARALLKTL